MATDNFGRWLALVLVFEGGNVDDPQDPGGRTSRGVTQRTYDGYRRRKGQEPQDVYRATTGEVRDIYKAGFWDRIRGDELPPGIDIVVGDGAVNSGPAQSVKWLQRALGNVQVTGTLGDATLAACAAHPDHDALIAAICERRLAFLRALKTWRRFGKGWARRVDQVERAGQAVASGNQIPNVGVTPDMGAKARLEDAKRAPPKLDAVWGAGAAGGVVSQATDVLTPVREAVPSVGTILTVLAIVGALLTIGGLIWRQYAASKSEAIADALDLRPVLPDAPTDPGPDLGPRIPTHEGA